MRSLPRGPEPFPASTRVRPPKACAPADTTQLSSVKLSPLPSLCSGIFGIISGLAVSLSHGVKYPAPPVVGRTSGVPGAEEGAESVVSAEEDAYDDVLIVRRLRLTLRINLQKGGQTRGDTDPPPEDLPLNNFQHRAIILHQRVNPFPLNANTHNNCRKLVIAAPNSSCVGSTTCLPIVYRF